MKDISTAPKDGTSILASDGAEWFVARWTEEYPYSKGVWKLFEYYEDGGELPFFETRDPIAWVELPELPKKPVILSKRESDLLYAIKAQGSITYDQAAFELGTTVQVIGKLMVVLRKHDLAYSTSEPKKLWIKQYQKQIKYYE